MEALGSVVNQMKLLQFFIFVSLACSAACGPKPLYSWGSYGQSVDRMYVDSEKFNPGEEVALLLEEIESIEESGDRVPPGMHAHLGYLYSLMGDETGAVRQLEMEKNKFPESTVFMDVLIQNITGVVAL